MSNKKEYPTKWDFALDAFRLWVGVVLAIKMSLHVNASLTSENLFVCVWFLIALLTATGATVNLIYSIIEKINQSKKENV